MKIKIKDVVESVSITHSFNKDKLHFLNTSDVLEGKIINDEVYNVSELKGQAKKTIKNGDILFSEIRPKNKHFAIVNVENPDDYVVSTKLMVLRKFNDLVDFDYLYYSITNDDFLDKLQRRAENRICSFPQITFDVLGEYEIELYDMPTQKKLAGLLASIDGQIDRNNTMIQKSKLLVQTIYNRWFMQFEFPNEDGKPYKSSGGQMVYDETLKRDIPVDWVVNKLSSLITIKTTSVNPFEKEDDVFEHYSIPAFDECHYPDFTEGKNIESNKYVVYPNSILVSKLNPHFKRIWSPYNLSENAICSTEFMVYYPNNLFYRPYLYALVDSEEFYKHISSKATSSTGSRKRIQPDISVDFDLCIPPDSIITMFCEKIDSILKLQDSLYVETYKLKQHRDWLLPLLMNGQLTIE